MNATARYVVTASSVVVGLFVVGAAANAIAGSGSDPGPIGDPVVIPSSPALDPLAEPVVEVPAPEPSDLGEPRRRRGDREDDGVEIDDGEHEDEYEDD